MVLAEFNTGKSSSGKLGRAWLTQKVGQHEALSPEVIILSMLANLANLSMCVRQGQLGQKRSKT